MVEVGDEGVVYGVDVRSRLVGVVGCDGVSF